ncbi:MAG TPA: arsenate reductase ArsC [Elusimicrobiota bacterium]|jgi:protein-tyrosine-phosphatase|nr:arsenate reductase ArsC [Elusimicrobiota bacterium]
MKPRILFVCVENSCRSQMAEGFARLHGAGRIQAFSAGSRPSGKVNGTAVALMKEKGVDLGLQSSKGLSELPPGRWDAVVTMGCGDACPSLPVARRLDWALPDPKLLPLDEFRGVRDEIEARVKTLLAELTHA